MSHGSDPGRGHLAALTGMFLLGAAIPILRAAVGDVPPFTLAAIRFLGAGVLLTGFIALRDHRQLMVPRGDMAQFALLGLIFFCGFAVAINIALMYTSSPRASLLLALSPVWSALGGRIGGSERLRAAAWLGIGLSFIGVAIACGDKLAQDGLSSSVFIGDALALIAGILGAIYAIRARRVMARHSAPVVTAYAMVFGTIFLAPAVAFEGLSGSWSAMGMGELPHLAYLCTGGGAVGFWLFTLAFRLLSPTRALVYGNMLPFVTTAVAVIGFGETISVSFTVGLLAVVAGVVIVQRS